MKELYAEKVVLARYFLPGIMQAPFYCPLDQLAFYAGGCLLSAAHAHHVLGNGEQVNILLDALGAIMSYDPADTDAVIEDLVACGFHVAAPITGAFYPPTQDATDPDEYMQP